MNLIIKKIQTELKNTSDEKTLATSQLFFKEEIKSYGVKTETVRKISKNEFKTLKTSSKSEIFELCEELWKSGYMEESLIACDWSYSIHKKYEPGDFQVFEKWIKTYVNNWASCDTFCNHTMGAFLEMYPQNLSGLKIFARSDNRWMRRAASVSLIIPARKGKFLKEILEIASLLIKDKDGLVQKGYGWMLKVASQSHQQEIFDFVMKNKSSMPRTALRYAIEKMPTDLKELAMKAE
jgi:3-methyladenine DNA glycosylase AlkD